MRRTWSLLAAAALLAVLFIAVPHTNAFASSGHVTRPAAGCYSTSCYNKDPYQEGCSWSSRKTVYLADVDGNIAQVWNYYSQICDANWTQGQIIPPSGGNMQITIYTSGESTLCYPDDCRSYYNGNPVAWTNMVNGTNVTTSCVSATSRSIYPHRVQTCVNQ